jgi:hypothetical protein
MVELSDSDVDGQDDFVSDQSEIEEVKATKKGGKQKQESDDSYGGEKDGGDDSESSKTFGDSIEDGSVEDGDGKAGMYSDEEGVDVDMGEEIPLTPEQQAERKKQKRIEKLEKRIKLLQKKQDKERTKKRTGKF